MELELEFEFGFEFEFVFFGRWFVGLCEGLFGYDMGWDYSSREMVLGVPWRGCDLIFFFCLVGVFHTGGFAFVL